MVLIEGHTDYKGTREANLAGAERRPKAAVSLLLKEGVPDTRMWTVSHGSGQPVCPEKTKACGAEPASALPSEKAVGSGATRI